MTILKIQRGGFLLWFISLLVAATPGCISEVDPKVTDTHIDTDTRLDPDLTPELWEGIEGEMETTWIDLPAEENDGGCRSDFDCQNGVFCDGREKCVAGVCLPADAPACHDDKDCTVDQCDEERKECTYQIDNSSCDDGLFCNGQERCSVIYGCVAGIQPDCNDNDPCTSDRCDEDIDRCINDPKDADGDGHVERNCGGDDCQDNDPEVNPEMTEICDDGKDNDCNNLSDMSDPACLEHLCDSAQVIDVDLSSGSFTWTGSGSTAGGTNNFEASCAGSARSPDVPYKLVVPSPATVTIEVTSASSGYDTALHVRTVCGDPASQIYCDDDGGSCSLCSRINGNFAAGTYIVIQDGFSTSNSGTYTLTITATPAP